MKVRIGKPLRYIGPYQIAEFFFGETDKANTIGKWLSTNKNGEDSILYKLCNMIFDLRKRTIKVKIHPHDTWSMDETLSHIILPMLIQLKETKHGAPYVSDDDVPDYLKSTAVQSPENDWDVDSNHFKRWEYVLDEMIWAFTELSQNKPGEDSCFDFDEDTSTEKLNRVDFNSLREYNNRLSNATRLFGVYYQSLWD